MKVLPGETVAKRHKMVVHKVEWMGGDTEKEGRKGK